MTTQKNKEHLQRIHLRERFVDSGFIQVFQWKNFQDYFNIELEIARKEVLEELRDINTQFYKEFGNPILFHWWFDKFKELEKKE
jgi:hypothetical protein